MVSDLFSEWVHWLDKKFVRQRRKILLFVDDCAAHPQVKNLQSLTLHFLPPIMNFKVYYRWALPQHLFDSYDSGAVPEPVNVKQAILVPKMQHDPLRAYQLQYRDDQGSRVVFV